MRYRDPVRRSLPFAEWPTVDQEAWRALTLRGDILGDEGAGARWAPGTLDSTMRSYGHWLTWIGRSAPERLLLAPADRANPQIVADWVAEQQQSVAPLTVRLRVAHLHAVLAGTTPGADLTWLRRLVRRLDRRATPVRDKRARVVGADELCASGVALMDQASAATVPVWQDAQRFRDGLMLALLASRPVRMRNFVSIEVGRHLIRRPGGFELCFEAGETKTGQRIDFPVPDALVDPLERYLAVYRPLLRNRALAPVPTDRLWLCRKGTPMEKAALYERIITLTRRELKVRINPHLFRDCAATSIALEDPGHVRITRSILGHSTLRSSERHYNHAGAAQATRRYQDHIEALRKDPGSNGAVGSRESDERPQRHSPHSVAKPGPAGAGRHRSVSTTRTTTLD